MQEFEDDKLVKTEKSNGDFTKMGKKSTHRIFGFIPPRGTVFGMNGLQFVVIASDSLNGRFVAKTVKYYPE